MTTSSGLTTLGNRTFFYGGASGIDTTTLITAAYNAKKAPADKLDTLISKNTTKITGYSQLATLSEAIRTSLTNIRKSYSSLSTNASLFDARSGTLSSNTSMSAEALMSVTIDPGTTLGSHQIVVQQQAQNQIVSSYGYTTPTTALGMAGSFSVNIPGKTAASISVTSGMSLTDVATAINAQATTTGVGASVQQVSETNYELVLTAADTNKTIQVSGISGTNVLKNVGVIDAGGAFKFTRQAAQAAQIKVDGTTYTRDSNTFTNIISGVNITVKGADAATTVQLKVGNDTENLETAISNFVDSYNKYRDFITTNQTVKDGAVSSDAVLFGDITLKSLNSDIQTLLGKSFGSSSNSLRNLRDIGLTIDADNHLTVDTTKLQDALTNKFDQVRAIFETSVTSDNSNFKVVANTSKTQSISAALNITYSGGAITGVSVGGDSTLFDISGTLIKGKSGTAYEGLSFAYVGTTSATVNFAMEQGIADLADNSLRTYSDALVGSITGIKTGLTDQNTAMETRKTDILSRADDYRQKLIDKYSTFESRMAAAQTTLAQIRAIVNANNNN